ncbi:hypothetical protein AB1Y20_004706 [Prymnesium parvum]|uniref:PDEase domain-containing protein n=1 Tax=Prymnesium parvum TaxID=97485 RepID=A0AB34J023_PRYPA
MVKHGLQASASFLTLLRGTRKSQRCKRIAPAPSATTMRHQVLIHVHRALALLPNVDAVTRELEKLEAMLVDGAAGRVHTYRRASSLEVLRHTPVPLAAGAQDRVEFSDSKAEEHEEMSALDGSGEEEEDTGVQEWLLDTLALHPHKPSEDTSKWGGASLAQLMSYASTSGTLEKLRKLIKDGTPVDLVGYDQRTALHVAASAGLMPAVKLLVEELGASSSPVDRFGSTPLDDAIRAGHGEVAAYLKRVSQQRASVVEATPSPPPNRLNTSWWGSSLMVGRSAELCHAAATGDVGTLRMLVEKQGHDVNQGDYARRTPLHIAATEGRLDMVKLLVEELGAELSLKDHHGRTPLDDTITNKHTVLQAYLEEKGAKPGLAVESLSQANAVGASFWMAPEALSSCICGEYFAQIKVDDEAQAMAARELDSWGNNMLALDEASGGHSLLLIGEALLNRHDLVSHFNLDRVTIRRFLVAAEAAYAKPGCSKLYHNSIHGADVALGTHLFLTKFGQVERLSKVQLLAVLVAAMMHDFNHPGTTNPHEVRVGTSRAHMHSDSSVLERHHLHSTFCLLSYEQFNIFAPLSTEDRRSVRALMIELVLATDLARHFDFVSRLRTLCSTQGASAWQGGGPWTSTFHEVDLSLVLQVAIKFADLGHATRAVDIHRQWTQRITDEFHALGDAERELGIPISALCDRHKDTVPAKSQLGFFRYICLPFFSAVADLIDPNMLAFSRFQENFRVWQIECLEHCATVQGGRYKTRERRSTGDESSPSFRRALMNGCAERKSAVHPRPGVSFLPQNDEKSDDKSRRGKGKPSRGMSGPIVISAGRSKSSSDATPSNTQHVARLRRIRSSRYS